MALFGQKHQDKWNRFISERIKQAREERNMSQEELAKRIYKNRVTISDYERGRTQVSASDLQQIAYALEKPITFFYPDFPKIRGANTNELDDREKELIRAFRRIGNNEAEILAIQHVRKLADTIEDIEAEAIGKSIALEENAKKTTKKK